MKKKEVTRFILISIFCTIVRGITFQRINYQSIEDITQYTRHFLPLQLFLLFLIDGSHLAHFVQTNRRCVVLFLLFELEIFKICKIVLL